MALSLADLKYLYLLLGRVPIRDPQDQAEILRISHNIKEYLSNYDHYRV